MRARPSVLAILVVVALGFSLGYWATVYGYWVPLALSALSSLGLVQLSDDRRRAREHRIREALAVCGLSISQAADLAGMQVSDFSNALSGNRGLDDRRLEMIGDEFRRVLSLLELRDRGLPELARTALRVAPMVLDVKRRTA
jgi:hypothetical protein